MRDSRTLLLILVSVCLIGTWVFYIYDKVKKATVVTPATAVIDTVARNKQLNDSLANVYRSSVQKMEQSKSGEDSLNLELQQKIREIDTLRNEINQMLNINTLTRDDLEKASKKIQQLQRQITQLTQVQDPVSAPVQKAAETKERINPSTSGTSMVKEPSLPVSSAKSTGNQVLQAEEVRLQAFEKGGNEKGKPTSSILQADYLTVSFTVRNRVTSFSGAQVYLVLRGPSGQVILDDEWLSGVFNSNQEGAIRFSRRLSFDYNKNETKTLASSVQLSRSEPGVYSVFLYHNGQRIGKADLSLQ